MSLCVPEVAKSASLLDRGKGGTCAEDERCVPCTNPLKNNAPTGVCEIGAPAAGSCTTTSQPEAQQKPTTEGGGAPSCPHTGPPVVDVNTFPSCGDGARCVPSNVVPPSASSQLKPCGGGGLCAPEKSIAAGGQYLPKTCKSVASAEGRCLNVNIPAVEAQQSSLPQGECDANERCTPCFSPLDGKATGACSSVSCDAPKQAAVTFKGCCTQGGAPRGKCVPAGAVPEAQQSKLDAQDPNCQPGELCAPNESLNRTAPPMKCQGSSILGDYTGVCISDCVKLGFIERLGTDVGTCNSGFFCAPCTTLGQPTGAPGCEP
jgi:hypothetical protein